MNEMSEHKIIDTISSDLKLSTVEFDYLKIIRKIYNRNIPEKFLYEENELVIILKWIGTIKEGEELNINNLTINSKEKNTILNKIINSIVRTIYNEGRRTTIEFLYSVVVQVVDLLNKYLIKISVENREQKDIVKDIVQLNIIVNSINSSIEGIINLKNTYKDDRIIVCILDNLVNDIIKIKLNEIKEKLITS